MSKNTYEALTTEYEAELDKKNPWGDYPRPLMRRESFLSLNGKWDFAVGGDVAPEEYGERILVPFPPESRLSGICRGIGKHEMLYYRREVEIPSEMLGGRLLLHFGAVDQIAWVKVNGVDVGYHEGGYLPFTIDITEVVRCGKNEIAVRVKDELDRDYLYMLRHGATTFWETIEGSEDFSDAGSLCHGWSALPIYYYETLDK